MPNTSSYAYYEKNKINREIENLLKKLPVFCSDYMYAKSASNKFQPRTKLAYLQELLSFFKYLCLSHEEFFELEPAQIKTDSVKKITARDITAYLSYVEAYENEHGYYQNSASGKARKLAAIRSLFNYLVFEGVLSTNVASLVESPTIKRNDIVYMSTEQQETFLKNVYNGSHITLGTEKRAEYKEGSVTHLRDVAMITMFLGTGIRVSELVALNISDVNFIDCSIYVTRKGGKQQRVYFSSDVEDALLSYIDYGRTKWLGDLADDEPALFISQRRKRITVRAIEKILGKYTKCAFGDGDSVKFSPHKLRSTYATNLLEESGDIALVANIIGHSDLSTVSRYSEVKNQRDGAISLRLRD